ncbi:uncharacterized protein [Dysidea avara]|uniref:uncharacterized protein n=1 Tax=Dysidea avara TaxID=196820 RepID=UPI00332CF4DC
MPPSFTIKEKFAPAQKNEVQVPFKRTSKVPGQKKQCKQLSAPKNRDNEEMWLRIEQGVSTDVDEQNDDENDKDETKTSDDTSYIDCNETSNLISQRKRKKRCGSCENCLNDDCGKCVYCLDKPKFNGPGKKKQCCITRRCTQGLNGTTELNELTKVTQASAKKTIGTKASLPDKVTVDQYYQGLSVGKFLQPPDTHFTDNPIPPQYIHLFGSNEQVSNCQKAYQFISSQRRKIVPIFGDGNCLFRSLSYAVYGDQDLHFDLRNKLVGVIRSNRHKFHHLIMQHTSMEQHINQMCKVDIWGTQVEIYAMATLYNIPVYIASQNPKSLNYFWCKYTPILLDDHTNQETLTTN